MRVSIWDKVDIVWVVLDGVKRIVQVSKDEIDIDGVIYSTLRYDINFIDYEPTGF